MANMIFGNHTAVRARQEDRERIREFYRDLLGCVLMRAFEDKDDFRMGDAFFFTFIYGSAPGVAVDEGANYAPDDALSDADFRKAIFLELKSDDVDGTRRRIVDFGVTVLDVPDPHLYFQAPGGQVFRLIGSDEDMSRYEGTTPAS